MYFKQFFIEGLGCASYLIGCQSAGVAAVVDPDRDVRKYLQVAAAENLRITHIIETHLHADHVSGNIELAKQTGATIYISELSQAGFSHTALQAGDVLQLGRIALHIRPTPGHTPEGITVLIVDGARSTVPVLALTGDTLFVGDVGRPDLTGKAAAQQLAQQLYHSIQTELLTLPDGVLVYPGHGSGSLCGKALGAMRVSTIGYERHANLALAPRSESDFVDFATHDLPEQPGNHSNIKANNRQGPRALGDVIEHPLSARQVAYLLQSGVILLDLRDDAAYTRQHIPGSIHLLADQQLSNKIGFAVPSESPLVLLLSDVSQYVDVVYALARVGYSDVRGYLHDTLDTWEKLGLPVQSGTIQNVSAIELYQWLGERDNLCVVDVREPWEYAGGHIDGAILMPLAELAILAQQLDPRQPVAVVCASGGRSQAAAALLGRLGFGEIYNMQDGMKKWMQAGLPTVNN